ncbi:MAG: hypothetical protein JXI32_09985 [Deltaproteobacteria bacterium]|nr:hypothetical protein [Deltaproteobacteria bacterium]
MFAFLCICCTLPVVIGFAVVDCMEDQIVEALVDLFLMIFLIAAFFGIKKLERDVMVYRLALGLLSAAFFYNVAIGSGAGTAIYWLFPFPLVFIFFLGKREGLAGAAFFFGVLCLLFINPLSLPIYPYSFQVSLRFLVSLLFVTIMAYGLEASREKYGRLLMDRNDTLVAEKQNLERAMGEIKTLSGLIPICASCKKIRNDEGYWQQVEIYVRDRSTAQFSHGICPDCFEKLYPGYQYPHEQKQGTQHNGTKT